MRIQMTKSFSQRNLFQESVVLHLISHLSWTDTSVPGWNAGIACTGSFPSAHVLLPRYSQTSPPRVPRYPPKAISTQQNSSTLCRGITLVFTRVCAFSACFLECHGSDVSMRFHTSFHVFWFSSRLFSSLMILRMCFPGAAGEADKRAQLPLHLLCGAESLSDHSQVLTRRFKSIVALLCKAGPSR